MKKDSNKSEWAAVWIMCAVVAAILWVILIAGKASGAVGMSWPGVWLGCIWIPAIEAAVLAYMYYVPKLVDWMNRGSRQAIRSHNVQRRIRAQAKALGIWAYPPALGGKALTMSARENFRVRRRFGETDAELRMRCMLKGMRAYRKREGKRHG